MSDIRLIAELAASHTARRVSCANRSSRGKLEATFARARGAGWRTARLGFEGMEGEAANTHARHAVCRQLITAYN